MNFSGIKYLYIKELREILRNWGLIILLVFFPLVVYPASIIFMAEFGASQREKLEKQKTRVLIQGHQLAPELVALLKENNALDIVYSETIDKSTIPEKNKAILIIPRSVDEMAKKDDTIKLEIYYDSTDEESKMAKVRLEEVLFDYRKELIHRRLENRNLNPEFIEPIVLKFENTASPKKIAGQHLGEVLPLILIMFIILGTIQVAIDVTAGEKERKTVQTLLLSPLSRLEILNAKLLIVLTTTLFTTAVNFISIGMTVYLAYKFTEKVQNISISPFSIILSIILAIPLVILISSLFILVGLIAKNQLEANIYSLPILFIGILPAMLPSIPGIKYDTWMGIIPIVNTALAVKASFLGNISTANITITLLSNSIYAVLVILFVGRLFQREDIVFGGLSDIIFIKSDQSLPSPGEAILFFLGTLTIYIFIGNVLQQRNLEWGLVASQILLLLFPAIYLIVRGRYDFKKVLKLKKPGVLTFIIAPFIGWSAIVLSQFYEKFQHSFIKTPMEIEKFMLPLLTFDNTKEALFVFFVVAITPAIIEEIAFRGIILSGLQNSMNRILACLAVGFLFSLFHLNLYIFIPVIFLGAVITYAVLKTGSIYTGMIIHLIINGTQIILVNTVKGDFTLPDYSLIIALIILIGGLIVLPGEKRTGKEST